MIGCRFLPTVLGACLLHGALTISQAAAQPSPEIETPATSVGPEERHFVFQYAGTIAELEPGSVARVWLPLAEDSASQEVRVIRAQLPAPAQRTRERRYGNALVYFEARANSAGEIPFRVDYVCSTSERGRERTDLASPCDRPLFLKPARLIPLDAQLLRGWAPRSRSSSLMSAAREIYDAVDRRMRYDKPPGQPWGRGDAKWACDSGFGNCTDFHSLFLAACRFHRIPARFEIGFPVPNGEAGDIPGYHCWAAFEWRGKWIPVDISEADKHPDLRDYYFGHVDANRVRFTIGRDLELEPRNDAGPVNYLVYPHVEVDGRVHSEFRKQFRYRSLSADEAARLMRTASATTDGPSR